MNTLASDNETQLPVDFEDGKTSLLQMIHDDNTEVAELFFQFTQTEDEGKREIFEQIKNGLTIHAQIGEELFYPLIVEVAEGKDDKEEAEKLVAEAEAGNYIASLILDELTITDTDDQYFEAKMSVLCKLIKEQVKIEEKEMFEKLQASDIDFDDMAQEVIDMKTALAKKVRRQTVSVKKSTNRKTNGKKANRPKSKAPKKNSATSGKTVKAKKPLKNTANTKQQRTAQKTRAVHAKNPKKKRSSR